MSMEDKVIEQALKFYDQGMAIEKIIDRFPKYEKELGEVFALIRGLESGRQDIYPSRDSLHAVLGRLPVSGKYASPGGKNIDLVPKQGYWETIFSVRNLAWCGAVSLLLILVFNGWLAYAPGKKIPADYSRQDKSGQTTIFENDMADLERLASADDLAGLENDMSALGELALPAQEEMAGTGLPIAGADGLEQDGGAEETRPVQPEGVDREADGDIDHMASNELKQADKIVPQLDLSALEKKIAEFEAGVNSFTREFSDLENHVGSSDFSGLEDSLDFLIV